MLRPWQFTVLVLLGAVALLLAIANGVLFTQNRAAQAEVNARQQYLQQTVSLEGLYRDIVKALAELAVKNNDQQLLQMLGAQGINVSVNAPAVPAPQAAPQVPAAPVKR
jgi:cobalamin biosynthesis protein CbiD